MDIPGCLSCLMGLLSSIVGHRFWCALVVWPECAAACTAAEFSPATSAGARMDFPPGFGLISTGLSGDGAESYVVYATECAAAVLGAVFWGRVLMNCPATMGDVMAVSVELSW